LVKDNFRKVDEVILKIDIEGSEYDVFTKMLRDGTFELVDKLYGEFHEWGHPNPKDAKGLITSQLKARYDLRMMDWKAEDHPLIEDIDAPKALLNSGGMLHFGCQKDQYALDGK